MEMHSSYPSMARLALKDCAVLNSAGSQLELLLADVVLNQPNFKLSEEFRSLIASPEPLPALVGTVSNVDAVQPKQRCSQLFDQLLSLNPKLYVEKSEYSVVLCPVAARKPLQSEVPDSFGSVVWVHSIEEALKAFDSVLNNANVNDTIRWISVDSLIDTEKYKFQNGDLATDMNPEGRILSEGATCLSFVVSGGASGTSAQLVFEPFAKTADTEITDAIQNAIGEVIPESVISNRSANDTQQISEWYRALGSPRSGLEHLSTRQSLGDTGLNETATVLALAYAASKYNKLDYLPACLIFVGAYRLYWQPSLVVDNSNLTGSYINGMNYE